jgi:hypothetical protein
MAKTSRRCGSFGRKQIGLRVGSSEPGRDQIPEQGWPKAEVGSREPTGGCRQDDDNPGSDQNGKPDKCSPRPRRSSHQRHIRSRPLRRRGQHRCSFVLGG